MFIGVFRAMTQSSHCQKDILDPSLAKIKLVHTKVLGYFFSIIAKAISFLLK